MKPAELQEELNSIDVSTLTKTVKRYRAMGAMDIIFSILSFMVGVAGGYSVFLFIFTPLFLESDSILGWGLIILGAILFINGFFDLSNNFRAAAILELRRAKLLRDQELGKTEEKSAE